MTGMQLPLLSISDGSTIFSTSRLGGATPLLRFLVAICMVGNGSSLCHRKWLPFVAVAHTAEKMRRKCTVWPLPRFSLAAIKNVPLLVTCICAFLFKL